MTYDARTPARPQPVGEIVDIVDIAPLRNSGYLPPAADSTATEALSLKLIRAMIGAAKADGRIDASESAKIFGQIETLGLDPEEKSFLLTEIDKPLSARDVAKLACGSRRKSLPPHHHSDSHGDRDVLGRAVKLLCGDLAIAQVALASDPKIVCPILNSGANTTATGERFTDTSDNSTESFSICTPASVQITS